MDLNELLSRHQRSLWIATGEVSSTTRCNASKQADEFAKVINRDGCERVNHPIVLSTSTLLELLGERRSHLERATTLIGSPDQTD